MNTFDNKVNLNWFNLQMHFFVKENLRTHLKAKVGSTYDFVLDKLDK
jgi:hypothetical protein